MVGACVVVVEVVGATDVLVVVLLDVVVAGRVVVGATVVVGAGAGAGSGSPRRRRRSARSPNAAPRFW